MQWNPVYKSHDVNSSIYFFVNLRNYVSEIKDCQEKLMKLDFCFHEQNGSNYSHILHCEIWSSHSSAAEDSGLRYYAVSSSIARAERDGTRAETRFRLSPKWTSQFKSVGASVLSTACRRGVRISLSNAGYTTFRGGVSIRQFPLHFPSRVPPGSEWAVHTDILKDCWAFILRVRKSRSYDYTAWLCRWRHCVLILWNTSNYLSFGMI